MEECLCIESSSTRVVVRCVFVETRRSFKLYWRWRQQPKSVLSHPLLLSVCTQEDVYLDVLAERRSSSRYKNTWIGTLMSVVSSSVFSLSSSFLSSLDSEGDFATVRERERQNRAQWDSRDVLFFILRFFIGLWSRRVMYDERVFL